MHLFGTSVAGARDARSDQMSKTHGFGGRGPSGLGRAPTSPKTASYCSRHFDPYPKAGSRLRTQKSGAWPIPSVGLWFVAKGLFILAFTLRQL